MLQVLVAAYGAELEAAEQRPQPSVDEDYVRALLLNTLERLKNESNELSEFMMESLVGLRAAVEQSRFGMPFLIALPSPYVLTKAR